MRHLSFFTRYLAIYPATAHLRGHTGRVTQSDHRSVTVCVASLALCDNGGEICAASCVRFKLINPGVKAVSGMARADTLYSRVVTGIDTFDLFGVVNRSYGICQERGRCSSSPAAPLQPLTVPRARRLRGAARCRRPPAQRHRARSGPARSPN